VARSLDHAFSDARRAGLSKMPAPLLWLALFLDPIGRRVWRRRAD
jgi:hypothetical protein